MIKVFSFFKRLKLPRFFSSLIEHLKTDDLSALASKMTFFILLSIFPFFIFLIEILKYTTFKNPVLLLELEDFFPFEIILFIQSILNDLEKTSTSKGLLSVAIIVYLWSASKGIMSIIQGLNRSYHIEETRSTLYIRFISVFYTGALAIILLITFAFVVLGNAILALISEKIQLPFSSELLIYLVKALFSLVVGFIFFILLYNTTPNKRVSFKEAAPGAAFSTLGWIATSYGFSYYIQHFNSISVMYGSLSSVIALMIWLYIVCNIILIGGVINAIVSSEN